MLKKAQIAAAEREKKLLRKKKREEKKAYANAYSNATRVFVPHFPPFPPFLS